MKVLSLFSGIGAFEKALNNIGINFELVNYCEIDKYASKSYCAIHNVSEDKNLIDVTKINPYLLPNDIDLITHGSPCQDFSLAGLQAGGDKGSNTRSSLMWNTVDIVKVTKPKYVVWENVKNLLSDKHKHNFDSYLDVMLKLGYNSYYKVLNAKDYGIPQNRERIFTISIRQDIDKGNFSFPNKRELKLKLKDILEDKVDEKYYLSNQAVVKESLFTPTQTKMFTVEGNVKRYINSDVVDEFKEGQCADISFPNGYNKGSRVHDISPAINVNTSQSSFVVKVPLKRGYSVEIKGESLSIDGIDVLGNYSKSNYNATQIVEKNGIAPTVRENHGQVTAVVVKKFELKTKYKKLIDTIEKNNFTLGEVKHMDLYNRTLTDNCGTLTDPKHNNNCVYDGVRIRKFTPKECFRLMGFSDDDFEKAKSVPTSDNQLYKQAGNSIVVNVLEEIFREIFL